MSDTAASIPYEGTDCTPEEAVEAVKAVRATAASPVDHLCGWMGCKHAEAWHGEDGCIVPVMDYATVRYNAAGEKLPPQERPCGCTWVEPCAVKPRPIKDRPQA